MRLLIALTLFVSQLFAVNPNRVLILVNDNTPAETGTGGVGASLYVAQHYASARNVPGANILHLSGSTADQCNYNTDYLPAIETPVKAFLDANSGAMRKQILYIVATYGVCRTVGNPTRVLAVDSLLSAMYAPPSGTLGTVPVQNPYLTAQREPGSAPFSNLWTPASQRPLPFEVWADQRETQSLWKLFAVSRLDATTAVIASGLVDKAILAEATLRSNTGTAYWEWMGTFSTTDWQLFHDQRIRDGAVLSWRKGVATLLHRFTLDNGFVNDPKPTVPVPYIEGDQTGTSNSDLWVGAAPNAVWSFGRYHPATDGIYTWVPGAIGSHMISCSGDNIRFPLAPLASGTSNRWSCSWMGMMLESGITGTWGSVDEPLTFNMGHGIDLADFFFGGYSFADAFYLSQPVVRWTYFLVGDPLYQPRGVVGSSAAQHRTARINGATIR